MIAGRMSARLPECTGDSRRASCGASASASHTTRHHEPSAARSKHQQHARSRGAALLSRERTTDRTPCGGCEKRLARSTDHGCWFCRACTVATSVGNSTGARVRFTSTAGPNAPLTERVKHDRRTVEKFYFNHGRYPTKPTDSPGYEALLRVQRANLAAQATAPKQLHEPDEAVRWRQRTAWQRLRRMNEPPTPRTAPVPPHVAARPRESAARRTTATGGADGGDGSRPDDDQAEPPGVAIGGAR